MPRILVVEDEAITATDIQRRIRKMGHETPQFISSGEEAIVQAERLNPSLVLMDIHLKGSVDGIKAADRIRSLNIPVVFLTAYSDADTLKRAKVSEPYAYLLKPFDETELRMTIDIALNNHAIRKRVQDHEVDLSCALSSLADGIICMNGTGQIVSMNAVAEALTGWTEVEAQSKSVEQIFRTKSEIATTIINDALSGRVVKGEIYQAVLLSKSGVPALIEAELVPRLKNGLPLDGAVLVIRELGQRFLEEHTVAETEKRASTLLKGLTDVVFRLDRAGTVLDAHFPTGSGDALVTVVGSNLYQSGIPHTVVDQILTEVRWALEKDEPRTLEFVLPAAGRLIRQWTQITPTEADEVVMIMRDVTASRSADMLRQVSFQELVNREIEAFSESVAGALFHPALITSEMCEQFDKRFGGFLPADGQEFANLIKQNCRSTRKVLEDLAFFVSLKTRPINKNPVYVAEIVQDSLREASSRYDSQKVEVLTGRLPNCFGSEPLVRQLFANLIDNAFKFSAGQSRPRVLVGSYRLDDEVCYYVRDNGIGFDDQAANKIFGPFQRLCSEGDDSGGVGLGLAVAQRIVERHRGRIWAQGEPDEGATFSFTLPNS
jgi:PAS domain S-box-containing protein